MLLHSLIVKGPLYSRSKTSYILNTLKDIKTYGAALKGVAPFVVTSLMERMYAEKAHTVLRGFREGTFDLRPLGKVFWVEHSHQVYGIETVGALFRVQSMDAAYSWMAAEGLKTAKAVMKGTFDAMPKRSQEKVTTFLREHKREKGPKVLPNTTTHEKAYIEARAAVQRFRDEDFIDKRMADYYEKGATHVMTSASFELSTDGKPIGPTIMENWMGNKDGMMVGGPTALNTISPNAVPPDVKDIEPIQEHLVGLYWALDKMNRGLTETKWKNGVREVRWKK